MPKDCRASYKCVIDSRRRGEKQNEQKNNNKKKNTKKFEHKNTWAHVRSSGCSASARAAATSSSLRGHSDVSARTPVQTGTRTFRVQIPKRWSEHASCCDWCCSPTCARRTRSAPACRPRRCRASFFCVPAHARAVASANEGTHASNDARASPHTAMSRHQARPHLELLFFLFPTEWNASVATHAADER